MSKPWIYPKCRSPKVMDGLNHKHQSNFSLGTKLLILQNAVEKLFFVNGYPCSLNLLH